jgi:2,3-bisphosphoglycerate-independent phosphoglycerate mutase
LNKNDVISKVFNAAKAGNGRLHLCGLVSHGGVVWSAISLQFRASNRSIALQAGSPLRPAEGRQGDWRPTRLHPHVR